MYRMIRQERVKRGWTQEYVARRIGLSLTAIQKIETGERNPSYPVLVKLEDLFQMNHRDLFGGGNPGQEERTGRQSG